MRTGARSAHAWDVLGTVAVVLAAATWPAFAEDHTAQPAPGVAGPPARDAAPQPARVPDRGRLSDTARLVACYGAFGFGYIIPATFLPVMAREVIDDPLVFGWAWPLFGLA